MVSPLLAVTAREGMGGGGGRVMFGIDRLQFINPDACNDPTIR